MATILIAYATRQGQTAKIAEYLATGMRQAGHEVPLLDTDGRSKASDLARVDAVVVAAPIHAGGYPKSIVRFVRAHAAELRAVPTAFCSVGLGGDDRVTRPPPAPGRAHSRSARTTRLRRPPRRDAER